MTEIVVAKLQSSSSNGRKKSLPKNRIRRHDGRTVYIIDSSSKTFDDDLVRAFKANIAAERRGNTAIFGSPDGPKKS